MHTQPLSIASSSKLNAIIESGKNCDYQNINNEQLVSNHLITIDKNLSMNDVSYCIESLRSVFGRLLAYPRDNINTTENTELNRLFHLLAAEPNAAVILVVNSSHSNHQQVTAILVGSCQLAKKVLMRLGHTLQPKSYQKETVMPHNGLHLSINHQPYAQAVISGISFVVKHLKANRLITVFLVPNFHNVAALLFLKIADTHGNSKDIVISCSEDVGKTLNHYYSSSIMPYIGISR